MSKIEELRKELNNARDRLIAKGWKWDGESGNLMDIKPFEIAYQEAIEKVFPDYIWWELTNYWDIFDAMMSGINDKDIIEEIINHIDPSAFEEEFGEIKEDEDGDPILGEPQEHEIDELEKEDTKVIAKLTEGTSNFPVRSDFDLLVFYTFDEFSDMIRYSSDYPNEASFEDDNGNVNYEAFENACQEFEDKMWEENEVCVLDDDDIERLKDKLDDFNLETKSISDRRWNDEVGDETYDDLSNLEDIELKIEPGYYEAAYIDVDNENSIKYMSKEFGEEQSERIAKFLEELRKEFGLTKLGLAYGPASNGETGFKIIKEAKPANKGKKKARIIGNPEAEKTFFNVANGTCESCKLSEAKEKSYEEMFDELIDGVEFELVKYSGEDRKSKSTWDDKEYEGDWGLIDTQGANLGGIEEERFNNAKEIIDRLNVYISDYFLGGQDGLEVSEEHQDELDDCYTYEEMLEFFKKYPEEDENGYLVELLDFIVNHAKDVDLEKCTFEEFGEDSKGSEVWVLKFIDKDGNQVKEMGKPMALDCTKALAQKLVDAMNKYPGRVGMTHEIEKAPYADSMSYEIIDSDDVEEWISKIEAEGEASNESLKEEKEPELPKEVTMDMATMNDLDINPSETGGDELDEIIGDWLSDEYGYCHFGFEYDVENDHINIYNIEWDTSESLKESSEEEVKAPKYADDLEIEIANKLEKAFPQSKGVHDNATDIVMDIVDFYQTYYDEGKTQDEIRAKLIAKLPDYGVTHMGMAGRIIDLVIKEFGIDKWDWSEGHPTESLKEEEKPFVCPRPAMKHKKIKEAREDSVGWFESVKCYGAPGDEPSEVYEPGQGAYCLVDEDCFLVDRLEKYEREAILDQLIKGGSQFAIGDNEYEIEFAGDCDWDEAWPHILRMFKQGKLNGVFKLDKKQECKEEKTISSKIIKAHRK